MTSVPPQQDDSGPTEGGAHSPSVDKPTTSRRGRWFLAVGCLIVLFLIGGPLVATAILDSSGSAGDIQTLGFGTGGSGCTLDGVISSVPLGAPVHMVGSFTPDLPRGSKVTVTVSVDGATQPDLGGTIDIDTPSNCVNGIITPHLSGHYVVRLEVEPGSMPPLEGTFDVSR